MLTLAGALAVLEIVSSPGLAIVELATGEVTAVVGEQLDAPPIEKSYRNPSADVKRTLWSTTAGADPT